MNGVQFCNGVMKKRSPTHGKVLRRLKAEEAEEAKEAQKAKKAERQVSRCAALIPLRHKS